MHSKYNLRPEERGILCFLFDCLHKNVALEDELKVTEKKVTIERNFLENRQIRGTLPDKEHIMSRGKW